jgi:hypothetical protein
MPEPTQLVLVTLIMMIIGYDNEHSHISILGKILIQLTEYKASCLTMLTAIYFIISVTTI